MNLDKILQTTAEGAIIPNCLRQVENFSKPKHWRKKLSSQQWPSGAFAHKIMSQQCRTE